MAVGVTVTKDNTKSLMDALTTLTRKQVYVGIPREENEREDEQTFGNAAIGYLNEKGSPAQGIPPRHHLIPGVLNAQSRITNIFATGGKAALAGDRNAAEAALIAAGQVAADSVRRVITSGLEPPLADSTLAARVRNGTAAKGAAKELKLRASGKAATSDIAKPLIATGEYKNSITFVVRDK